MKVLTTPVISLSLLGSAVSQSQMGAAQADASKTASAQDSHSIEIARSGSQQPSKAPAEHFTGSVQIEPLFLRAIHCAQALARSPSNQAREVHGIRIR